MTITTATISIHVTNGQYHRESFLPNQSTTLDTMQYPAALCNSHPSIHPIVSIVFLLYINPTGTETLLVVLPLHQLEERPALGFSAQSHTTTIRCKRLSASLLHDKDTN
jgi:hypothetical protein